MIRSFGDLVYKGILPEYLEDSVMRLAVGAAVGMAIGIPLGLLVGLSRSAHAALWPPLLFFQAIGDIAWLPILLIWFGFGLATMTFVIVYTVLFPVVLNTVLGVRSVPRRAAPGGALARRLAPAHPMGGGDSGRAPEHHHRPAQRPWLRLARAHRGRDHRRHERRRLPHVRARRAGSVVEILLGMIVLGILWYVVDAWVLAPIERATGERWGLVTR